MTGYTIYYKDKIFQVCKEVHLGTNKAGKTQWMITKYETIEDARKVAEAIFSNDDIEWVEIRNGKKAIERYEK